ncbi:MAG: hypothetical protein DIZ80_09920 [endosymbiont of Galathealinum brachiosum]|uniref:Type II secretion system protein H n=1 Tax=endosymbiont of Galathealinum brachiosum TaxID=2200906 RepID=A0A370DCF1_9GAMM|nr:MAG: hypothetical protein DIZ80_09920 [endosymbiont of Galathealinum brachiosum]
MHDFLINIVLNITMKNISGFTLIELMATIVVMGFLIAVGLPGFQDFMKAGQITTVNNEFVSAVQVARSGAIQLAEPACVCSSSNAESPTPSCSGSDSWEDGWISFVDVNTASATDCVYDASDDDVLLKAWNGVNTTVGMTVRSNSPTINASDFIRFNSRGIPASAQGVSMQGMFVICDDRGLTVGAEVLGRGVILSASGSLRTTKDAAIIGACL